MDYKGQLNQKLKDLYRFWVTERFWFVTVNPIFVFRTSILNKNTPGNSRFSLNLLNGFLGRVKATFDTILCRVGFQISPKSKITEKKIRNFSG